MAKPDNKLPALKDPTTWSVQEVCLWLTSIDLTQYKATFAENAISGAELFDIKDEDLTAMSITQLGHRKKLLANLASLKDQFRIGLHENSSDNSSDHGNSDRSGSKKSAPTTDGLAIKCSFNDEITVIRLKKDRSYEAFKKAVRKEFKSGLSLKYKDRDGDMIPIRKESHYDEMLESGINKVFLSEPAKDVLTRAETQLLENLVDAVVIINTKGTILFANKCAEKLWGFTVDEMMKQNVKMLMPESVAVNHDTYLTNYLTTKKAKIIGIGRKVMGKHKQGHEMSLFLTISETKTSSKHIFTATCQAYADKGGQASTVTTATASNSYAILDHLLDMAVVIDDRGTIQFANKEVGRLLGYSNQHLVGRNVKMLMPAPFDEEHDGYIKNYLTTGQPKVIGTGREVVAQTKDGSIVPIHLSVTEQAGNAGRKVFTGIMRTIAEEKPAEKSVLQMEREVLEGLLVPAVVIDEAGIINAMNKPCQELFGYTLMEVLGKNVKMLMTTADRDHHDGYLRKYKETGKSSVIGVGRDVIAQHKNGSPFAVRLSVTTKKDSTKRIFSAVLQKF